ncbi:MAG: DUF4595 domain-containing protein [Muribaculaceae bacterium]|nr:DUF4595 domain-containing protein [Muribaculaceae bacterium]
MNKIIKLTSIGFAAFAMVLTSCSDDDDDDKVPGIGGEPSIDNVFTQGLPTSVDGTTFTTNDKGQVTKIVDGSEEVTFEYGTFSRATQFNALMKIRDKDYPTDGSDFYMQLNGNGFVTYAEQVYLDAEDGVDTWKFEYNADGQLTRLQRSEGGDDFTITYTNGDITKVVQVEEDGDRRENTFVYTNAENAKAVANKGNIMLFDDFFHIDMDEMGIAYFAGMLGKSTKNLPMGYSVKAVEGGSDYTNSETYHWEFNADNLPTRFWSGDYEWDAVTFAW